ncbi:amidohydrolase family protein [Enemella dayhoffiae]|uniref:amidohydrolase family protein n=1 Tax=Enemella dayhoffiae TaxID=2016507 RepID=UPI001E557178|nr:amidohydrolase family protein [Enemella dayhoffiae]
MGVVEAIGVDNVVFGSDYPHPEGLHDPVSIIDEIDTLSREDQAKIMGGNLNQLMGFPADDRALVG